MIKLVIFDLDDTIYDEIDYCRSGFKAVAEFLAETSNAPSPNRIFDAFWEQFSAGNRTRTFNAALDGLGIPYDDHKIGHLVDVYRNHVPKIILPRESREVLEKLHAKYILALLTDGFLPAQQLKVQALGIERYLTGIVYTERLGREYWKPSPAGFEKILNELDTKPENAVYVADNENKDFIGPNKLGLSTIRLINPAGLQKSSSEMKAAKAKYEIHRIRQLPALLEQL
jgi:putative hydrolase of the HAD superfamily